MAPGDLSKTLSGIIWRHCLEMADPFPCGTYFTNFSNAVGLPGRNGFLHSNHFFRAPDSRAVRSSH
jgi:hypothetical protein